MKKDKSKIGKNLRGLNITPEKARCVLIMTGREYRQTKEYQDEAKKELEKKIASMSSDLKPFQEMVNKINRQIKNSGVLQQIQYIQRQYANLLKTPQPIHAEIFLPKHAPENHHFSPEDIDKIARRSAYYLLNIVKPGAAGDFPVQLVLAPNGDLYKQSDPMLRYSMRSEALRLKILKKLMGKSSFYESRLIMYDIESSNYGSFTKAIGEINKKARDALKLSRGKKHNLIISKPYSGYMINPLYAIRYE